MNRYKRNVYGSIARFQTCSRRWATTTTTTPQQRHGLMIDGLDHSKGSRERVVILGSGWAGYTLCRSLDANKYQAVVVSPRSYFVFTPLLASTSVGTLEFRVALEPIRQRRTKSSQGQHYLQGWAEDVDFENKTLTIEESVLDPRQSLALTASSLSDPRSSSGSGSSSGSSSGSGSGSGPFAATTKGPMVQLQYDKLVIAVGCYTQTFNIPGVKRHANFLKDVGDARKIRIKVLQCFEMAALPNVSDAAKRELLHFVVVGGGPTGIEFAAELHDLVHEDLEKLYPGLNKFCRISLYDVAPQILSMFDGKLAEYAMSTFQREGIEIHTSRTVKEITPGLPSLEGRPSHVGITLDIQDEGATGAGMCVWSTGLMMNPFVAQTLRDKHIHLASSPPSSSSSSSSSLRSSSQEQDIVVNDTMGNATAQQNWAIATHSKTGSVTTNAQLRVLLQPLSSTSASSSSSKTAPSDDNNNPPGAYIKDVFAIGDCATMQGATLPATAQVASQQAEWLAKRLNRQDLATSSFEFKNLGVMAYLGNARAIFQGGAGLGGAQVSGRTAWLLWRSAYLYKSLSWRNRILMPVYWIVNWLFGRDISRF